MIGAEAQIVGREAEIEAIDAFLGERAALPASLVIEGPAGAGKSTLWQAAVDRAAVAGYVVLAARPSGAEVQLSLAALADLLEPRLGEVSADLAAPQRRALEVALLLAGDEREAPDQRAIAAGALSAVRVLASRQPVVLAVDDAQWLDPQSAQVLAFALRRLRAEPVAVVTAWRTEAFAKPVPATPHRGTLQGPFARTAVRVDVGPLSLGAMHRLLRTRTSLDFNRRTLQRIHETSGGNPFYALEIARALERAQVANEARDGSSPAEPLPLSADLNELLSDRLDGFDPTTKAALFVAAAAAPATIELIERAVDHPARALLGPAINAAIVRIDGEAVEFTHPLFAAAAYNASAPGDRRAAHARIAEVASDPETSARHLALARPGADREVSGQLLEAARHARDRGAQGIAAELFVEAIERLPADGAGELERARILDEAAPVISKAGEPDRARRLLDDTIAAISPGPLRAELLLHLAKLVGNDRDGAELELHAIEQALAEAEGDVRVTALALLDREQWERGEDRLADALTIARRALAAAEEAGDEAILAEAHVRTADLETVLGIGGDPIERFERALALAERHRVDAQNSARSMLAVCLIRRGRVDEARPYVLPERARAIAEGDEASVSWVCMYLAELEWLAGRWDAAEAYAREGWEVAEQAGLRYRIGPLRALVGLAEAARGDPERARELIAGGVEILEDVNEVAYGNYAKGMLGFLELSLGNAAEAHQHLNTYGIERGIEGSKRLSFIGDEIEALVLLGDLDRAANLASELVRRGEATCRPTLSATAARGRALVLGARGDLDGALASAREAVDTYARLNLPFEHARCLLVLGEVQRRAKQRKAARDTLTAAEAAFDRLGARLWSERAKAERARIGGRTTIEGLSETELRVAKLVASGRSNKEVAAELFVSVRAVEANLSRVYAKLGIESRTELARRL